MIIWCEEGRYGVFDSEKLLNYDESIFLGRIKLLLINTMFFI